MRTVNFPALLILALLVPGAAAAQDAALASPLTPDGTMGDLGPRFVVETGALARLSAPDLERVRLSAFPNPVGDPVELALERVRLDTSSLELFVDGAPVAVGARGLSLWRGRVVGVDDSEAFLGFSPHGTRGWFRTADELVHVLAEPDARAGWRAPRTVLVTQSELDRRGLEARQVCDGALLAATDSRVPRSNTYGGSACAPAPQVFECKVAWETDFQLYQQFNDFDALEDYVLMLLGAVSQRYEEQIGTVLTSVYLGFYTTAADPWNTPDIGGSTGDMLNEFRDAWVGNLPAGANLGHFLSGASLGGGVAWLDVLCNTQWNFAVSANLTQFGLLPGSPATQGPFTWDFYVICHELGHNFGSPHTFDYSPPLDDCPNTCITTGTIMSYCHLCGGGTANITTYFHPTAAALMRSRVESSCLETLPEITLGTTYCDPAVPNSTGWSGRMLVKGSETVADDDLVLLAQHLPPESNIGYFIMGAGTNTFTPPGSDGPICVTPGLVRYLPPVSNTNEGFGSFCRAVGTSGPISSLITVGSVWNFQAWHRDQLQGVSNLTDAVSIEFQ